MKKTFLDLGNQLLQITSAKNIFHQFLDSKLSLIKNQN